MTDPQFSDKRNRLANTQNLSAEEAAIKEEQRTFSDIQAVLERSLDAVRLLQIISPNIAQVLPQFLTEQREAILKTRFRDLVISTNGLEVATSLINAMITLFTEQSQEIEMLCGKLAEKAPTFFSNKQRTRIKADDLVRRVGSPLSDTSSDPVLQAQKIEYLNAALKLYLSIVPEFSINSVCVSFRRLGYYSGVVELAAAYGRAADPNNLALAYYHKDPDKRETDLMSKEKYEKCVNAYQTVVELLDELLNSPREDTSTKIEVLKLALKVDDELFQHTIFQWYVERKRANELLMIDHSKYLPRFLARGHEELLAQYHTKNGRHADASMIYATLAEKGPGPLASRVALLSRAHNCAQCASFNNDYVCELTDKLDVAVIQLRIYERLQDSNEKQELDQNLFDLSVLYNKYAVANNLLESQLEIIRAAKHEDPVLVISLWDQIIQREITSPPRNEAPTSPLSPAPGPQRPGAQLSQFQAIVSKVTETARPLNRAEFVFPLEYLLDKLEKLGVDAGDTGGIVLKAMHSSGGVGLDVPFLTLWETYKTLLHKPDWQNNTRTKAYLLNTITVLLEEWSRSSKTDYNDQKQFNALKVSSAFDELLSDINTLPTSGDCDSRLRAILLDCNPGQRLLW